MQIAISHHYWEDGVNAGWHPGPFPAPSIKGAIENDYLELGAKRPQWREYGAWTVFFTYRDARDFDNRPIVNISCAFVQNCNEADAWAQIINPLLEKASFNESTLDMPQLELKKKKSEAGKFILRHALRFLPLYLQFGWYFIRKVKKKRSPKLIRCKCRQPRMMSVSMYKNQR